MSKPIPAWPPTGSLFFIRAVQIFRAWKTYVDDKFAIAMLTQAEFESAFNPKIVGDHGQAYNIYQWHWKPRGEMIYSETAIDVRTEFSFQRIVDAAWWEMNHTEKRARDAIIAAKSVEDATHAACVLFEGAGADGAADRRAEGATRWANFMALPVGRNLFA